MKRSEQAEVSHATVSLLIHLSAMCKRYHHTGKLHAEWGQNILHLLFSVATFPSLPILFTAVSIPKI
jgi:hypothetical protein